MKFDTVWAAVLTGIAIAAGILVLGYLLVQALLPAPEYQDPLARKKESCLFCAGSELREHRAFGRDAIDPALPGDTPEPALISERRRLIRLAGELRASA